MKRFLTGLVVAAALWFGTATTFGQAHMCPDGTLKLFNPTCGGATSPRAIPADFRALYGDPPSATKLINNRRVSNIGSGKEFSSHAAYRAARDQYNARLAQFVGSGLPAWVTPERLAIINAYYVAWNLGVPVFYETVRGEFVRFPNASPAKDYEAPALTAVVAPGVVVAHYQVSVLTDGGAVDKCHDFNRDICTDGVAGIVE